MIYAKNWFEFDTIPGGITRICEPHVHPYFNANMWLIAGANVDLIVDFGNGVVPLRPNLDLSSDRRQIALATHIHVDHVGSFNEFDERLGYGKAADEFAAMPDSATLAHMFRGLDDPVSLDPFDGWSPDAYTIKPAPLTGLLTEGDIVDIGSYCFHVLHLPGHSPDSIGLYDPKNKLLVSGDAIYDGQLIYDLPGADLGQYLKSMSRLAALEVDIVLPGHGQVLTGQHMKKIATGFVQAHS